MNRFLTDNSASMRLARTIVQAVIGVLISYADILVGQAAINPELRPMIVALVMAVLSPIMAILGEADGKGKEIADIAKEPEIIFPDDLADEIPEDYEEPEKEPEAEEE